MRSLRGVIPILNSAFQDNGDIDFYSQQKLVEFLLESGVHGIALFGTASEGYTLSGAERESILKLVLKVVNGRIPIVVSTGATGTRLAVEQSVAAEEAGADALMIVPPYYLKPDGAGVRHYFGAIAERVKIPIMIQDAPLLTGVTMPAPSLAALCKDFACIQYVKIEQPPTAPKITAFVNEAGSSGFAFGGLNGQFLIEEVRRGSIGVMPGSDLADRFQQLWALLEEKQFDAAQRLFNICLPLLRYELQPGLGVSTMKTNLVRRGVLKSAVVRHPTLTVDKHAIQEIATLWQQIENYQPVS
ncbi:MAG TPA: dihydrodipicolinate synthase family protein [Terriglobales bacterium]|nr:dihydrodipicolinate synthase family protein [Terriglobales bacterium]